MADGEWHHRLEAGRLHARMSVDELWWRYFAIGGSSAPEVLPGVLSGAVPLTRHEYDLYAQALNDYFTGAGLDHPLPFSDEA